MKHHSQKVVSSHEKLVCNFVNTQNIIHFCMNTVVYLVALFMYKILKCVTLCCVGKMSLMNILKTCSCSHQLTVPHICHSMFGTCAFDFAGPMFCNSVPTACSIQLLNQITFSGI